MKAAPRLTDTPPMHNELAHPLDEFYARNGQTLPPLRQIDGLAIPEPYRSLLVHENDMTSTLELFHGGTATIEVLGRQQRGDQYFREVILRVSGSQDPVEFGAIKINLALFPADSRQKILKERWPLGRILKESGMPFTSSPKAYLYIASDPLIDRVLGLSGVYMLYGRRNTLSNLEGQALAEIVEILPPVGPDRIRKHGFPAESKF